MKSTSLKLSCVLAVSLTISTQAFSQKREDVLPRNESARWYSKEEILQFDIGGVRLKMSPDETLAALRGHGYLVDSKDEKFATCGFEDAVLIGVAARKGLKDRFGIEYQSHYDRDQHHMIGANYAGCSHGYVKEISARGSDGSMILVSFVSTPSGAAALEVSYELSSQISYKLFASSAISKYGKPSLLIKRDDGDEVDGLAWTTLGDKGREDSGVHTYNFPYLATETRGDDSRWLNLSMGDEEGWLKTIDEAVESEVDRRYPQVAPKL